MGLERLYADKHIGDVGARTDVLHGVSIKHTPP